MTTWQTHLKESITDQGELLRVLGLSDHRSILKHAFPVRVPRPFIARMQKRNIDDPLLQQVFIQSQEYQHVDGYSTDPLNEKAYSPVPGILHKYHGRVLVIVSNSCAINCRYCFRREFPYAQNNGLQNWQALRDYIANDESINEVILSGGDPLIADDERLQRIIDDIEVMPHITTLRIHTRLPVVIPDRLSDRFYALLENTRLNTVMVLHINHPNEIDTTLQQKIKKFCSVATLLNQSVLLKGINDQVDVLEVLSKKLFDCGVLPYYLHHLDAVSGAHHFSVTMTEGKELIAELQKRLPGYLVPRFVKEIAGEPNKTAL